jgi:hypothetical protein
MEPRGLGSGPVGGDPTPARSEVRLRVRGGLLPQGGPAWLPARRDVPGSHQVARPRWHDDALRGGCKMAAQDVSG